MKKLLFAATALALVLYACQKTTEPPYQPPQDVERRSVEPQDITLDDTLDSTIKLASFNIQIFGKSKREKTDVMQALTDIVSQYDIIAIQEVRDSTEETVPYFVERLNQASGKAYASVTGQRVGRSSSKEQYAFIYDTSKISYTGGSYTWKDTLDIFEREPFIAQFKAGNFDFVLANIHTKPADAKAEIMALEQVLKDADEYFTDDNDVIVLGDYNSDGSYFSEAETNGFRTEPYTWIIDDSLDTTVAASSNTYDRIVFDSQFTAEDFTGKSGVFRFDSAFGLTPDKAKAVSDHYPVWAEFYTMRDRD